MKSLAILLASTLCAGVIAAAAPHDARSSAAKVSSVPSAVSQADDLSHELRVVKLRASRSQPRKALPHQTHHVVPTTATPGCTAANWRSTVTGDEAYIISHEHGETRLSDLSTYTATHDWNPQPTSTGHAFGLGQLTDYQREVYGRQLGVSANTTDPCAQLAELRMYGKDRYGSLAAAAAFWQQHRWW